MRSTFRVSLLGILRFALKILGLLVGLNLIVLLGLWVLEISFLFITVLVYEGFFVTFMGVLQILGSYIYREESIPYRRGFRTGWFDFKKFARLKPEERERFRQEGIIMVVIGLVFFVGIVIVHFYLLASS
jgi:hypothetical protein